MAIASIYIKESEIKSLEKKVDRMIREVEKGKLKVLLPAARKVRNRIKQKAPKGATGRLKRATYARGLVSSHTGSAVAFAGIRPRKAPHAHLVEYGHGGPHPAPPHPFIRPAWDELRDEVQRDITNGVTGVVKGAA